VTKEGNAMRAEDTKETAISGVLNNTKQLRLSLEFSKGITVVMTYLRDLLGCDVASYGSVCVRQFWFV
jgi:hypothetical protein